MISNGFHNCMTIVGGGGNESSSCHCFGTNSTQDEGFSNTRDILELSRRRQ
jgi:hypothetical protein